mmetsp:Transcript_35358/g.69775  ORF Transcript_35358/g.69775 Transcript_35358/m.69775 type:complete len:215 (+) Transcript_35358:209-853(+)
MKRDRRKGDQLTRLSLPFFPSSFKRRSADLHACMQIELGESVSQSISRLARLVDRFTHPTGFQNAKSEREQTERGLKHGTERETEKEREWESEGKAEGRRRTRRFACMPPSDPTAIPNQNETNTRVRRSFREKKDRRETQGLNPKKRKERGAARRAKDGRRKKRSEETYFLGVMREGPTKNHLVNQSITSSPFLAYSLFFSFRHHRETSHRQET